MKYFTNMLRKQHLKATPQRLAILTSISKYGHINIDHLYSEIKLIFKSISLATIYKNINAMTNALILQEVKLPSSKAVYEITKQNHSHLLCIKCNKIEDIVIDLQQTIKIVHQNNFEVKHTDLILSGICGHCA